MPTVNVTPGSEVVYDDGGSSYFPMPTPAVVGSGPVLADADDGTYWDLAMSSRSSGGPKARRIYAQIPVPATPLTADGLTLTIRTDQAIIPTHFSDPQINVFIASLDGSTSDEGNFGGSFHWSPDSVHITEDSGFTDYTLDLATGAGGFFSLDDLVTFLNSGDAWIGLNTFGISAPSNSSGYLESKVTELAISSADPTDLIALPCDTPVDLDLSTAALATGQYVDGVITGLSGTYPQYVFPVEAMDPAKNYRVRIRFDSGSSHDGDGNPGTSDRWVLLWATAPGDVDTASVQLADAFSNTADDITVEIGPGHGNWDDPDGGVAQGFTDLMFQTSGSGAVFSVSIQKICEGDGPVPPIESPPSGSAGDAPDPDAGDPLTPALDPTPPSGTLASGGGFLNSAARGQAPTRAEIVVDGRWLSLHAEFADLTWSHVWPGGSANASWTAAKVPASLTRRGLVVQLMHGGGPFWGGVLGEPDHTTGLMSAVGFFTLGADYTALDADGNATTIPDAAVDAAIARGLPWKRRDSISDEAQDVDISQGPVKLGELLDTYATDAGLRWAVDPQGYVYAAGDPTVPTWHIIGIEGSLTPSDDDLATALIARYRNTSGDYVSTAPVEDPMVDVLGYSEDTIDLTGRGEISETKAVNKTKAILKLGRNRPAFADPVSVAYGDLVSPGQIPVALERAVAGQLVRLLGAPDATQAQAATSWTDLLVGQSEYQDLELVLTAVGAPSRSWEDVISSITNRRGDARG